MNIEVMRAIMNIPPDEPAALATIVATSGSAPRKAGTQAIFFDDGRIIGTIGGGYGETQAAKHALNIIHSGQPAMVRINLTNGIAQGEGMICGGIMDIFIEPLSPGIRL